ncbi:hypothetical protein BGZ96_007586 [Linnemannia gamsii]|uniref:MARVEL domain-containing protein n=1 Tax=Linnemannia gamsii TaxID=64522 RepID=A0ABQ7K1I0_9FUNG|nr:hypothetical protein BGZ96_007586 [Linnemannia gamsii]
MALMPTSITLFLVQIGTFFANIIVAICCGLYVSSYPKSPDAQSLSQIAIGTLAFACFSSLFTLLLILRQKSGKSMPAIIESTWIFLAIALWILAAVGGIIRPPNGMSNVSCKVLPDGKDTSDSNYIRACQAMFASTAFCIVSALFFIATAIMLSVFSVKSSWRNRKNRKNQVGGHYKLTQTLSQYRKAEKEDEEAKRLKGAGEHEEPAAGTGDATYSANNSAATTTIDLGDGNFSDRVYQDPYRSTMPAALPTTVSSPAPYYSPYGAGGSNYHSPAPPSNSNSNGRGNTTAHLAFLKGEQFKVHNQPREENERQIEQQQQQQYQYQQQQQQQQQQQSWSQQQPTFGGY